MFLQDNVSELHEDLVSVSGKWQELCISLKLPNDVIAQCRNAGSNNLRLCRGLSEWVCGRYKNARRPTLSQLKEALCSESVGRHTKYFEIEEKWQHKIYSCPPLNRQCLSYPNPTITLQLHIPQWLMGSLHF